MGTYILRRLLISIPVFFGITMLVFLFVALAPGDAASAYTKPELQTNPAAIAAIRERFGLNDPIPIRYVKWLANAAQGELGYRNVGGQPIAAAVFLKLQASLLLTGTALILGMLAGIPLGILSATRQYSKIDLFLTGATFLGISMPSFLLGIGGLYLIGLQLKLVPIAGMVTPGRPFDIVDLLRHLALPAAILGFGYAAIFMRYTRASMLDVINSEYITTARSKGLRPRIVIGRHGFRNALIPIITIVGLSIPEIVGAAVVTEQVFTWPGVGLLMVEGINQRDYFLIMGITIVLAAVVLIVNLITDIAYAFADPPDPVLLMAADNPPITSAPAQVVSFAESPTRRALRRLLRHRLAVVGLFVIALMILLAVIGDETRAYEQNLRAGGVNQRPGGSYLLGTDALGRDMLARTLVGGRISILVALVSVAIATAIGTSVGVVAGFFGGWIDNLLMRLVDIVLSFPTILLLIVVAALIGPGLVTMMIMIGVVSWAPASRIVRGQILSLREATFVEAARVIGVSDWKMIQGHILPNIIAPLIVFATFGVASVIIFEASLSYLNLGVQQPTPSWGNLINVARSITALERYPWQWVPAAGFIVLMVLAVNFVGDGLRDAFDQRATSTR